MQINPEEKEKRWRHHMFAVQIILQSYSNKSNKVLAGKKQDTHINGTEMRAQK